MITRNILNLLFNFFTFFIVLVKRVKSQLETRYFESVKIIFKRCCVLVLTQISRLFHAHISLFRFLVLSVRIHGGCRNIRSSTTDLSICSGWLPLSGHFKSWCISTWASCPPAANEVSNWLQVPCLGTAYPGVRGRLVGSVLECQSRGSGFKSRPGQKTGSRVLLHLRPLANSAMMSTLTIHCQWEDETVRERTSHPPSCADAKKTASLRDRTSSTQTKSSTKLLQK